MGSVIPDGTLRNVRKKRRRCNAARVSAMGSKPADYSATLTSASAGCRHWRPRSDRSGRAGRLKFIHMEPRYSVATAGFLRAGTNVGW